MTRFFLHYMIECRKVAKRHRCKPENTSPGGLSIVLLSFFLPATMAQDGATLQGCCTVIFVTYESQKIYKNRMSYYFAVFYCLLPLAATKINVFVHDYPETKLSKQARISPCPQRFHDKAFPQRYSRYIDATSFTPPSQQKL